MHLSNINKEAIHKELKIIFDNEKQEINTPMPRKTTKLTIKVNMGNEALFSKAVSLEIISSAKRSIHFSVFKISSKYR